MSRSFEDPEASGLGIPASSKKLRTPRPGDLNNRVTVCVCIGEIFRSSATDIVEERM